MDLVNKIEAMMIGWYKSAPHLPKNGQQWLSQNVWWIALIGVILGSFGIVSVIAATFLGAAVLTYFGSAVGAAIGGIVLVGVIVSLAFAILVVVLTAVAISPLKLQQKKGWNLLFTVLLLEATSIAIVFLFSFDIVSLLWGAIWLAVMGYFLFEIREYFAAGVHTKPESKKPVEKV